MTEKWIQKAIKKPGALHKELGIKEGKRFRLKDLLLLLRKVEN